MIVEFDKSFEKSIGKIRDKLLLNRIEKTILKLERSDEIEDIPGAKKLSGFNNYYRIRIGDYRLGFEMINSRTVRIIIFAQRKEIYQTGP